MKNQAVDDDEVKEPPSNFKLDTFDAQGIQFVVGGLLTISAISCRHGRVQMGGYKRAGPR